MGEPGKEKRKVEEQRQIGRKQNRFVGPVKVPTVHVAPNYHEMVVDRVIRLKSKMTDWELDRATYAVSLVRTKDGKLEWWVAAGGNPGYVRSGLREDGERVIRNKDSLGNSENRLNDGEQTLSRAAEREGATILAAGATRQMCEKCRSAYEKAPVDSKVKLIDDFVTPVKGRPGEETPIVREVYMRGVTENTLQPGRGYRSAVEGAALLIYTTQFNMVANAQFKAASAALDKLRPKLQAKAEEGYVVDVYAIMDAPAALNVLGDIFPEPYDMEWYKSLFVHFYRMDASGNRIDDPPAISAEPPSAAYVPPPETPAKGRVFKQVLIARFAPYALPLGSETVTPR